MDTRNIMFVPDWVLDTFLRSGTKLSDISDYRIVRHLLSLEDQQILYYMNGRNSDGLLFICEKMFGFSPMDVENYHFSDSKYICDISRLWAETKGEEDFDQEILNDVSPEILKLELNKRLFNCTLSELIDDKVAVIQNESGSEAVLGSEPFSTADATERLTLFVVNPHHFPGTTELQIRALEALLKFFYTADVKVENVTSTTWFRHYMGLLSKVRHG